MLGKKESSHKVPVRADSPVDSKLNNEEKAKLREGQETALS